MEWPVSLWEKREVNYYLPSTSMTVCVFSLWQVSKYGIPEVCAVHISEIYPSELVLKKTTENSGMVSYLDVGVIVTSGQFITTIYDKRDSFNFPIVNFPFMSSNIPAVPSYGIYISQLVRIGRICSTYDEFVKRNMVITSRLIKQGFLYTKLVTSFKKIYVKYIHLVGKYNVCLKNHISDGISGLYNVKPLLYKHVTTRRPLYKHVTTRRPRL